MKPAYKVMSVLAAAFFSSCGLQPKSIIYQDHCGMIVQFNDGWRKGNDRFIIRNTHCDDYKKIEIDLKGEFCREKAKLYISRYLNEGYIPKETDLICN